MKTYRRTWRHEVVFEAENDEQAIDIWESLNLGNMDGEAKEGRISGHELVDCDGELVSSFECLTDDYREIRFLD